jgi:hypothetical protein
MGIRSRRPPQKDSWQMRPHQQRIIRSIYEAALSNDAPLAADYQRWWDEVAANRGELDRKKKVTQEHLQSVMGPTLPGPGIDLNRFIYSVERYLLIRAVGVIRSCVEEPLHEGLALPAVLKEAVPIAALLSSAISVQADRALEVEISEHSDLFLRCTDGPLIDTFQSEFMSLVPRQVRHAIGSFYTPQWLARHVLRTVGFKWEAGDSVTMSVCDPACGSGVFLIAAAEEIRQAVATGAVGAGEGVVLVQSRLHGFDIEMVPCLLAMASLVLSQVAISKGAKVPRSLLPNGIAHRDSLETSVEVPPVDLVVGNPPWVNWEYLPAEYREKHGELWSMLGVFDPSSKKFSFSKEDISALFTAHAIVYLLSNGGRFAFVLPESLIKSTLNHRGFRRFEAGVFPMPYHISSVEDFVTVKPFEGVANRTIVMYGDKSGPTTYPVSFRKWTKLVLSAQPTTGSVGLTGASETGAAQLSDAADISSSWSTGSATEIAAHRALDGPNPYKARTGLFTGGANAVYHLRLGRLDGGVVEVENVIERAKRAAPQVQATLETDFIFPFLRGRDVSQWKSQVELGVLLPHTSASKMSPVAPDEMTQVAPRTLEYLQSFRYLLDQRKGFSTWERQYRDTGFYACQRVGDYTFADWKVVWRYIAPSFTTAVVGPAGLAGMPVKPVIPNEKLMLIACSSEMEAYYLGAVLASSMVVQHVHSRMISTQISPSIVSNIAVPKYDPVNPLHTELADICKLGHDQMAVGDDDAVAATVGRLNTLAGELWFSAS